MKSRSPERDNLMKRLRKEGKTLDEIGLIFGVKRQRVFQIVGKIDETLDKNTGQEYTGSEIDNKITKSPM